MLTGRPARHAPCPCHHRMPLVPYCKNSCVCFRIDFENYIGLVMAQCAEISRRVGLAEPLHLIFMEGVNELDSGILIKRKQSAMRCDQSR